MKKTENISIKLTENLQLRIHNCIKPTENRVYDKNPIVVTPHCASPSARLYGVIKRATPTEFYVVGVAL
ncbi:MAG: hypothetical protein LBR10_06800, partial [Prevotellaceae bacterium]|nr:hypothetical protein [Prevotellaceae bacterium]